MKPWVNVKGTRDIVTRTTKMLGHFYILIPLQLPLLPFVTAYPPPSLLLLLIQLHQGSTINHIPRMTQVKSKSPLPRMFYWISCQPSYVLVRMTIWDRTTCPFSSVSCLWQETVSNSSGTSCSSKNRVSSSWQSFKHSSGNGKTQFKCGNRTM